MPKMYTLKQINPEEQAQALKEILSSNIKKYRRRRNWSQFALAEKINISTNFLADIEAGNTWVSAQTLVKFATAFEVEAFELLRPQEEKAAAHDDKDALNQFSADLSIVLHDAIKKAFMHVKKQHKVD